MDLLLQARRNVKAARGLKKLPDAENKFVWEEMERLEHFHREDANVDHLVEAEIEGIACDQVLGAMAASDAGDTITVLSGELGPYRRKAPAPVAAQEPVQASLPTYYERPVIEPGHSRAITKKQPYGRYVRTKMVDGVEWVLHATKGWRKG